MKTLTPPVTPEDISNAFRAAKSKRTQYLEQHGWKLRCDFPDQIWRWGKACQGRELAMSAGSAYALERSQQ